MPIHPAGGDQRCPISTANAIDRQDSTSVIPVARIIAGA